MARTSRAERHRRRESALALVSQGKGFSDVVAAQMSQWGAHVHLPSGTVVGRMTSFNWALIRTMLNTWSATWRQAFNASLLRLRRTSNTPQLSVPRRCSTSFCCAGKWTMKLPKQVVLVGVIATATPALRRQGRCASPIAISITG